MACRIDVLFTPAEIRELGERDLANTTCVVFDVLRATSTFVTALANGATAIVPVAEITEALAFRRKQPGVLLAGERNGLRIGAALAGGVEFDLGNSPREYTPDKVANRTIVSTTTNGTRALQACAGANAIVVASFLNLRATANFIAGLPPAELLIVCAGTGEGAALEDVLAAGALCERLVPKLAGSERLDSTEIALGTYRCARADLADAIGRSQNGRRLLANPELRDDVPFCLRSDGYDLVAVLGDDGAVRTA